MQELYSTARILATFVVPNEYGVKPKDKLRIGSRICSQLIEKLLIDLGNTREESRITSHLQNQDEPSGDREFRSAGGVEASSSRMDDNFCAPNIPNRGMGQGASSSDGKHLESYATQSNHMCYCLIIMASSLLDLSYCRISY